MCDPLLAPFAFLYKKGSRHPFEGLFKGTIKFLERERGIKVCRERERERHSLRLQPEWQLGVLTMAFPLFRNTKEMDAPVQSTFRWHWRSASCPPCPIPEDYRELYPCFTQSKAKEVARDFEHPEMVQATFYAMLLNGNVELGIMSGFVATNLKASIEGLRWSLFESWMHVNRRDLLEAKLH